MLQQTRTEIAEEPLERCFCKVVAKIACYLGQRRSCLSTLRCLRSFFQQNACLRKQVKTVNSVTQRTLAKELTNARSLEGLIIILEPLKEELD